MSGTTTSRRRGRARLFRRLNAGTSKRARKHQAFEARLLAQAKAQHANR
jgi:hypothetical protein